MSKWTPGRWVYGGEEPFVYALNEAGSNRFFCAVQQGWVSVDGVTASRRTTPEEVMANARLIAAAPEMAGRLTEALDLVPRISDDDPMAPALVDWCRGARALLARIEGD